MLADLYHFPALLLKIEKGGARRIHYKQIVHLKSIYMSAEKVLIGALSGLVAGVAIGILVAPAEGSETRQRIADTADNLKRKLRKLRGITSDELDELKDIFEKETDGLRDDVRNRVLNLIKAAKEKGNHIKEEALS
jgi:gas vesicle protein